MKGDNENMFFEKNVKIKSVYLKLLISNMILVLLSVTLGIVTYNKATEMLLEQANVASIDTLQNAKNIMDARLMEIENASKQIVNNSALRNLLSQKSSFLNADYYSIVEFSKNLPNYNLFSPYIYDLMVYSQKHEIIISNSNLSLQPDLFFNSCIKYKNMDYSLFKEKLFSSSQGAAYWPSQEVSIYGLTENIITYVDKSYVQGLIVVAMLREKELSKYLINEYVKDGGYCCVTDAKGNIIMEVGTENDTILKNVSTYKYATEGHRNLYLDGYKQSVINVRSSYNGWNYIMIVPQQLIFQKVNPIKTVFVIVTIVTIFLGFLIGMFIAYRNSLPVDRIIKNIQNLFDGSNEKSSFSNSNQFEYIEGAVSLLLHDNTKLKKYMEEQKPLYRTAFIEKLLRGTFGSMEEINSYWNRLGFEENYLRYGVLLVDTSMIDSSGNSLILDEIDKTRAIIKVTCEDIIRLEGWVHNAGNDKIVLIIGLKDPNSSVCLNYLHNLTEKIVRVLYNEYSINVCIGIGNVVVSAADIWKSYQEALLALDYQLSRNIKGVIWYKNITSSDGACYYYPMDLELKLMNLIKSGEEEEVKKMIQVIYEQNFDNMELDVNNINQLINELRGTVMKARTILKANTENSIINSYIIKFDQGTNIKDKFSKLEQIFSEMCKLVKNRQDSRNTKLKDDVLEYIHKNYSNSDLTLDSIAKQFGIASNYLSHFFKEQTGQTFVSYLEVTRMKEATRLLIESEMIISEILSEVGYLNQNTFFKAFKRIYSITPSAYRTSIKPE